MGEFSLRDTIYIGGILFKSEIGQNMPTSRSECHVRSGGIHRHDLATIDLDWTSSTSDSTGTRSNRCCRK